MSAQEIERLLREEIEIEERSIAFWRRISPEVHAAFHAEVEHCKAAITEGRISDRQMQLVQQVMAQLGQEMESPTEAVQEGSAEGNRSELVVAAVGSVLNAFVCGAHAGWCWRCDNVACMLCGHQWCRCLHCWQCDAAPAQCHCEPQAESPSTVFQDLFMFGE